MRSEERERGKPGITHEFFAGDSSVSPLRYHRKEYWVFSSLSVFRECLCVFKKLDGSFLFDTLATKKNQQKNMAFVFDGKIHSHLFICTSSPSLLTHVTPELSYQQILSLPAFSLSLFVALL